MENPYEEQQVDLRRLQLQHALMLFSGRAALAYNRQCGQSGVSLLLYG